MCNASDDIHPIHLHRYSFELTNLAGKPTAGILKDVLMLGGYREGEVGFLADNRGLTLFLCHQQLHMDFEFMALFDYLDLGGTPCLVSTLCTPKYKFLPRGDASMAINTSATWAARTSNAVLLIRILVGWVFLSEGIQKFLFPEALGVGRFLKIGIPWPQVMAPFVGVVEIVCGTLLLTGMLTRLAGIPLVIDICVALYSTKIITLGKNGIWSTLHEARTDVSMLLGLIFLLVVGAGAVSLDARLSGDPTIQPDARER
jgi:putative oxidoreductase